MCIVTGSFHRRGCQCKFVTTMFANHPGALKLMWCHYEHVDKDSNWCHGMLDHTTFGVGAHIAPRLSKKFRLSIEKLLRAGLNIKAIMENHMTEIISKYRQDHPDEEENGAWSRDMQLFVKDIQTVREAWRRR